MAGIIGKEMLGTKYNSGVLKHSWYKRCWVIGKKQILLLKVYKISGFFKKLTQNGKGTTQSIK